MCLQLFCPLFQPAPAMPFFFFFFFYLPPVSLVWGQPALSHLAQGDPCLHRQRQNKKIASALTQIRPPSPMPHHLSVSYLFLWPALKATQCLRISTCSPSSTLNSVHPLPQLKVYLRLRFSPAEYLDVNIQSTTSLHTPLQRKRKARWKQLSGEQN